MYESKYLLKTDDFFARNPEISDEVKELVKKDIESADFDMFSFIMSYIFM